jgi:hypothetical protein
MEETLCDIMNKHGSDKASQHTYTPFYEKLFSELKNKKINLFELGIGTNNPNIKSTMGIDGIPGASLRGWSEYFQFGNIYGADIDRNILFSEDRIKTFYVDQTNAKDIEALWSNDELSNIEFDIIIDDGLHEPTAAITFFQNSFNKLKKDGIYIIEDVIMHYIPDYIHGLLCSGLNCKSYIQLINHGFNVKGGEIAGYDNCLLIIEKT